MTGPTKTEHNGLVRRVYAAVRFPPPVDDPLFSSRAQAASYLGAWGLTVTHLILWLLIAIGLLTSEAIVIGVSLLSFIATCLLIGMVIAAHRRLQLYHGGTTRHMATVWWRGPWDPVGRLVWLPPPETLYVLTLDVVRAGIATLQGQRIHERAMRAGSLSAIQADWNEVSDLLRVDGGPSNKPHYRPFSSRNLRDPSGYWYQRNLPGSYAPGSIRSTASFMLDAARSGYELPSDHAQQALALMLRGTPARLPPPGLRPWCGARSRTGARSADAQSPSP